MVIILRLSIYVEGKGTHTIDYAQYPIETPTIFFEEENRFIIGI
jgi:hypothetical protein